MKNRIVLGSLLLCLAAGAQAIPLTGWVADKGDCGGVISPWLIDRDAELYIMKVTADPAQPLTDLEFQLAQKGGDASTVQEFFTNFGWSVSDNWRAHEPQIPPRATDGFFVVLTLAGTGGDEIVVDSTNWSNVDQGTEVAQRVGNSLDPAYWTSIGLSIPGTRTQYPVDLGGTVVSFPRTAAGGIEIAFAPVADRSVRPRNSACSSGGEVLHPRDLTRGLIMGYVVYRIPDTGTNTGSQAEFAAALTDSDPSTGFVGFVNLRSVNVTVATGNNPDLSDLDPNDGTRLSNPDGQWSSNDEALLFLDGPARCAACGPAPVAGQAYWYAVQPVWDGNIQDFASTGFTRNDLFAGDHRMDLDGDGTTDAVSLDSVAGDADHDSPEFISPQLVAGLPGLGLTVAGRPLLSAPMNAVAPPSNNWRFRGGDPLLGRTEWQSLPRSRADRRRAGGNN